MNDDSENLPAPIWSGSFTIFGIEIKCHVLDNGQRIIEEGSMEALFEAMAADASDGVPDFPEGLAAFCAGNGVPDS